MKDNTTNILTAFSTALANITYNSEKIQVFTDTPSVTVRKYILLGDIVQSDALTQDTDIAGCQMDIEIVVRGYYQMANRTEINSITSSVLQAIIKKRLTITSGAMTVTPYLLANTMTRQYEGNEIVLRKVLTINFNHQDT
jgi:hypothetical protein